MFRAAGQRPRHVRAAWWTARALASGRSHPFLQAVKWKGSVLLRNRPPGESEVLVLFLERAGWFAHLVRVVLEGRESYTCPRRLFGSGGLFFIDSCCPGSTNPMFELLWAQSGRSLECSGISGVVTKFHV